MTSAAKYIIYLLVLHVALAVAVSMALDTTGFSFLLVEIVVFFSAYLAMKLYKSIIAPVALLSRGAQAMADQDFTVKLSPTGSAEMDRLVNVYNRMIDQLRAERVSSRQQEEFLDQLLAAAEVGVVILDFEGRVSSMNAWMENQCKQLDFRTAVLEPALHLHTGAPQTNIPESQEIPPTGTTVQPPRDNLTRVFIGPGNRRYHVEYSSFIDRGFERGFLIVQDVTTDILAAEREAYGKVIRMMAHEVNNSNAAITSVLRTLLDTARDTPQDLTELSEEFLPVVINRAENMTSFMRKFARVVRLPAPDKKRIDLNELLHRTGEVMESVLRESDIELTYKLSAEPTFIEADAAQIEQVVVNALTNARESIGRGGFIKITSSSYPSGFVIADNGAGIPAEVADQVFTPFFSTKPTGQGVGLTLTRDILEGHEATYQLATEEDGWTRLRVIF
ncbi:PAS domain-containing sensor histidine kinase [Lewinella sp. W8]|uniref:sensor histidine kinase n=1 Tax=Lewinella sp. W8 TaxID=2528208 RepID=UPI001067EBCB|nr:ATP-binding protein [Lewinella sp. W8]MTB53646.1 HAMP domain-containing protein [Lewinella sp. W8]